MSFNGPISDISDNSHSLLEPSSPAYTNVTVRRAFIVWMYCGQRNKFKDVCNYFHHLEALEDQLPPEKRSLSRHHEFNLFANQPPTSSYLIDHFPKLYKETYVERHCVSKVKETQNDLEGFDETAPKQGTTRSEIIQASRMIRKYCRIQMVSLKKFLEEFKQHARKCDLKQTVNNVAFYIKRKMIQAEIELEANYPSTLSFLDSSSIENIFNDIQDTSIKDGCTLNDWKPASSCRTSNNVKPIKILRKGEKEDDFTKNSFNITKCNNDSYLGHINNISLDVNKLTFKRDTINPNFKQSESSIASNIKSISIEDLTEESGPVKKERRFSGSQFMKIDLEKFRKI